MSVLTINYRPIDELKPAPRNPRTHSKKQLQQIARSITEFGFINPVLVDAQGCIVAGHGRVEAAKMLKMEKVPTVSVAHLSPAQVKAYVLADNKLAENADWDADLLRLQFLELQDILSDPTITGFETAEIDLLLAVPQVVEDAAAPALDRSKPAVSRTGDLWRVGEHLVLCGDSTEVASYQALMGNEVAGMVFTDSPYNVKIQGHVSGLGKNIHTEFAMASGEMTDAQFTAFLKSVFEHLAAFSRDGSLHYVCMDWRHVMNVLMAAKDTYSEQKNLCVWTKTNGGMGNLYRSQHELVFVFKNGTAAHINNVELGKHGRRGRAIEIDPYYVDGIIKRLETVTKKKAVLVKTGETFEAVSAWRRSGIGD